jgi:acetylornithine deacetylase/succinyl-diaminopimelate desuccinylase-like protein
MAKTDVYRYIEAHRAEHLSNLQALVRQPSVSPEQIGLRECAGMLRDIFAVLGCQEAHVVETGDPWPGVWAYYHAGARLTLGSYSFIDTYNVSEADWDFPPFGGVVAPFAGFPQALIGRGARNKGPLRAWLNALEAIRAVEGELPVNLLFISESAEMLGSLNCLKIWEAAGAYAKQVQAFFNPSPAESADGRTVTVPLGNKGLITFDLECSSERWGRGPSGGFLYGNTKSIIDSPTHRLILALASLLGPDGNTIAIDGLEHVNAERPVPSADEQALIGALLKRARGRPWHELIPRIGKVEKFVNDMPGEQALLEYMYGPSLNVSELRSGVFEGPIRLTELIPERAQASLDLRLVTDLPAAEVLARVRRHLDARGYDDIAIHPQGLYDGHQSSPSHPFIQTALGALRDWGRAPVVWPRQGFGGPWAHMAHAAGAPEFHASLGHVGNVLDKPNEYFVIDGGGGPAGLLELEQFYVDVLYRFAALAPEDF